jgi:hypothetical protein
MDTRLGRTSSIRTISLLLAAIIGLGAFLFAGTIAAFGLSLALVERRQLEPGLTLPLFSIVVAGAGLGLPLAWQAVASLRGKPSRHFALSSALGLALVLGYVLAVASGQAVLNLRLAPTLSLPVIHVVALALPPLLLLWGAAALTKDQQFTWRQMWSGLGGGAFGAVGLAFAIEAILLMIGVVGAVIVIGVSPDGAERLRNLRPTPGGLADPELLRPFLRNPAVIVTLFVSLGLIVPLIEEPAKSLVPALAGMWQTLTPTRGFLLGVASGAGFAVLEGMLNGALSVEDWGTVALLRVGSSAMHCLAAGLTGWGWGQVRTRRGWLWLVLTYVVAIVLHGTWNSISFGMAVAATALDPGVLQTALVTSAVGLLVLLAIGTIIALMWLAKR